ncbi:MAG TPA: OmpA family protein [Chitinophagales bacterium]|nr:OmpA family protein [Chitinophagales bacterium]
MGLVKITLFGLFSSFVALPLVAQETTTTNATTEVGEVNYNKLPEEYWPKSSQVKKKNQDQLDAYINGDTLYSPRLKRQMAIGLAGGHAAISGDVKSVGGFGTSIFFRHNISYILSARYEFGFYRAWGQNYELRSLRGDLQNPNTAYRNKAYNANNYRAAGVTHVYDNYKTDIMDLRASVLLNLTNLLLMHRKQTKFNLYTHIGGGVMNYKTWVDALNDQREVYQYREIAKDIPAYDKDSKRGGIIAPSERREVRKYLYDNVYNARPRGRDYETVAEGHKNEDNIFGRVSNFVISGGLGVEALLGKKQRFSIGVEHSVTFTNDDLLDGVRWSEQGDLTRDFDTYHYISARVSVFLGKKDKRAIPMWWDNPTATYLRKYEAPGDHFKDSDNDGVDDFYDLEANTKPDCPVDSKGRLLDSDGDGCPDCEDPEPFSSPLLPIVDCKNVYDGFASKECCDEKAMGSGTSAVFPVVAFAPDRFGVNKDQMAELDQIAKMMQENPDAKVVITGISRSTKNIKYNEQLAWLRANETVDYLVEKYGISRDRFIVEYQGENIKSEGGDFDKFQNNRVEFRYAEEGESGSSNPPAPHPGYKAGRN